MTRKSAQNATFELSFKKMLKIETAVSSSLLNGSHQLEMSLEHHKGKKYSYCKANIIIEEMNDNGLKEYIDKK